MRTRHSTVQATMQVTVQVARQISATSATAQPARATRAVHPEAVARAFPDRALRKSLWAGHL